MRKVAIVNPIRTAIGNFNGSLSTQSVVDLGAKVIEASCQGMMEHLEEIYIGQVLQAGNGQNPARQAAMRAGVPKEIPATSINTVCASGLHTVGLAYTSILAGQVECAFAGGMESMSNAPYLLQDARNGYRLGNGNLIDTLVADGLTCPINKYHMGITAENVANKFGVSRADQDNYAYQSQMRASEAKNSGVFKSEITPIIVKKKKEEIIVQEDEFIRGDTTVEKLSQLRPAFKSDGTVTAGNSSGINDGAAGMMVMTEEKLKQIGVAPVAFIKGYSLVGIEPEYMGMGPINAIIKVLKQTGMSLNDIDLFELNEAFAAQAVAVQKELEINPEKINIYGGAIAMGHPIGASGSRVLVTLLNAMQRQGKKYGIASLCVGTGMGIAILVENAKI